MILIEDIVYFSAVRATIALLRDSAKRAAIHYPCTVISPGSLWHFVPPWTTFGRYCQLQVPPQPQLVQFWRCSDQLSSRQSIYVCAMFVYKCIHTETQRKLTMMKLKIEQKEINAVMFYFSKRRRENSGGGNTEQGWTGTERLIKASCPWFYFIWYSHESTFWFSSGNMFSDAMSYSSGEKKESGHEREQKAWTSPQCWFMKKLNICQSMFRLSCSEIVCVMWSHSPTDCV